jgi:hydrogenase/urease accessory protein HupE
MRRNHWKNIGLLLLILFTGKVALAHEIRPAYLQIIERPNHIQVLWKQPTMGKVGIRINPVISSIALPDSKAKITVTELYFIKEWDLALPGSTLDQFSITISGLQNTLTDVLVRVTYRNGNITTKLIHPADPSITVDRPKKTVVPVWAYLQLGILHIWTGIDHLLFVFGLILLVPSRKKLIWTITSFTIAHSITLALAALGFIHVPGAPVEACIALSIMFVGVELIHKMQGRAGLASKFPWLVAFSFGLLHGLGFASALVQVGLPDKAIPLALFLFNAGVEIGQLAFVLVILSCIWTLRIFLRKLPSWIRWVPSYAIGSAAAFWFLERLINIIAYR